ncbi:hypothetical protein WA026_007703 [Henosepilachna vigintioctopunctata]|uniref:Uncharacterized protein n=1 Tax=Henosepilachna vigintioctopunctata TaxID=420089 RepID=A0AAW1TUT2_9CUCU
MKSSKMHWKEGIWVSFFIFTVLIFRASCLQCMDSELNGIRNCSSPEDICFELIVRDTKKITKGCYNNKVCEDIGNDTDCSVCHTDLCNSGSTNYIHFFPILLIGFIMCLGFVAT